MPATVIVTLQVNDVDFVELFGADAEQLADGVIARIGSEVYNRDANPTVPKVIGLVVNGEEIDLGR